MSGAAFLASIPYGLGVASILVGKHIDQRAFDTSQDQRTLPVLLGERRRPTAEPGRRWPACTCSWCSASLFGALSPFALVVVLAAAPRALHALQGDVRSPRRPTPPAGYIGWPLWYHRVCLVHNRLFGWLFIAGLLVGAVFPGSRL